VLENKDAGISQCKFVKAMRRVVSNMRNIAESIIRKDETLNWRPNQQQRYFHEVNLSEFKACLELTLKAHGSGLDKTMLHDHADIPEADADRHLGALKVVTDRSTGKPYRKIEGGENQGVVMLCNAPTMSALFGGGNKKNAIFAGLLHTLMGLPETIEGEMIESKYRPFLDGTKLQAPYAAKQRVMYASLGLKI
jgi:hypothetical protein